MTRAYVVRACGRVTLTGLVVSLVGLALASSAGAAPRGIFSVFGGCPVSEVNGRSEDPVCVYMQTTGMLRLGRVTLPIDKTITVQAGGLSIEGVGWGLVPPSGGAMMSKTPLEIPGGLNGLVQCGAFGGRVAQASCGAADGTEVTATIEVVASSSDPVTELGSGFLGEGPLLALPVRVHLGNAFLGNSCYLGSGSHPIMLELTFGSTSPPPPNKPISGLRRFHEEIENGLMMIALHPSVLVDNSFMVPVAEGCGGQLAPLVDPMLDARLGLPSMPGHNTAILDARVLDQSGVEEVILSEG
jgi:hypothetical protein